MSDESNLPVPEQSKKPWESRTIILNAVLGVLVAVIEFIPAAKTYADYIQSHGSEIAVFWSILAIVLRTLTKDKIVLRD